MTQVVQIALPPKLKSVFIGPADVRGAHGGRGSGKTRSFAKMTAVRGYMFGQQGISGTILCARQYMNSLDESSLEEIKRSIEEEPFLAEYYEIGEKYVRSRDGRIRYRFAGLDRNLASIKSRGRILICWVDEAEPVTDEAWSTLVPTLREEGTGWNAELWVTWNRKRRNAPVEQRFGESDDPRIKIVQLNWRDNPRFPAKLERERQRDLRERPEQYEHIWEGAYFIEHENQLIAYTWLVDARNAKARPDGSRPSLRVAVDVADGGADRTVVTVARRYESFDVLLRQEQHNFPPALSSVMAADAAEAMFNEFGGIKEEDDFVVDGLGVGAGTAGTLIKRGYRVVRYIGGSDSDSKKRYRNRRVQSHIVMRDRFRDHKVVIAPDCFPDREKGWSEFADQMCMVRRRPGLERVEDLETKEHMLQRTGKSPDRAESVAMLFATQLPERVEVGDETMETFEGVMGSAVRQGSIAVDIGVDAFEGHSRLYDGGITG
ncbi:MAG TPA: phage terminase large subunit [Steroidobacteraceae bacterium]